MASKDLHDKPFDEGTIAKLEIFEDYAQAWIPTWVMQKTPEIHIFDFFSGTGYDKNNVPGSPIRILQKIQEQKGNLFKMNVRVVVHLNEFEPDRKQQKKFDLLKSSCETFMLDDKSLANRVTINYYNEDFELLFPKLLPLIKKFPALVYLDQNGIKYLSEKYFLELEKTKQTDFLYFVSSSYLKRFGDSKEFKMHLDIDLDQAKKDPYSFIHRNVIEQIKLKLPANTEYKLYPYSIRKGKNIYGIIFGATHPRGVDKFLGIAWKRNEVNGEANFDIDNDLGKGQLDMFQGKRLNKIEKFQRTINDLILDQSISNNKEALDFCYSQGHIPKHATEILKELKKNEFVNYDNKSPLITYDNVYKKGISISYEVLKK